MKNLVIEFLLLMLIFVGGVYAQDTGDDGLKPDQYYIDSLLNEVVDDFGSTLKDITYSFMEKPRVKIMKNYDDFYATQITLSGLTMYNGEKTIIKIIYTVSPPDRIFARSISIGGMMKQLNSYYELFSVMRNQYQIDNDLF